LKRAAPSGWAYTPELPEFNSRKNRPVRKANLELLKNNSAIGELRCLKFEGIEILK